MGQKLNFIIFAHARSGSTNLGICLQQHPEIQVSAEPFHKDYKKRNPEESNYIDYISDEKSLNKQLSNIFTLHAGIKTLEYQLPKDLNTFMIGNPDIMIIFLQRKNLLKTVVSSNIASETKTWYKRIDETVDLARFAELKPLPIKKLRKDIKNLKNKLGFYSKILERRPEKSWMNLYYEDLYTENLEKNLKKISTVFDFLDLKMPDNQKLSIFLNPDKARMNSPETYLKVPNINEVEEALGSDETGWLFK